MNKRRRFKAKARRRAFTINRHLPALGITYSKYATARYLRALADPDLPKVWHG
jgi:hypothetical protein